MRLTLTAITIFLTFLNVNAQFGFSDSAVRARIRQDIYVLASDSLEGREAGTEGEKKAYAWIIRRLEEAGVKPWNNNAYLQAFNTGSVRFTKPAHLSIAGRSFEWRTGFGICSYSASDSVSSFWADAGNGLIIPEKEVDSYKNIHDVNGMIVLIDLVYPEKFRNDKSLANGLAPSVRIANAVLKGASGVILYNDPGQFKKHLFDFSQSDTLTVPVMYASSEVIAVIRSHPGQKITMATHLDRIRKTYHNIAGYIDNRASRTVVIGAHYDHLGKRSDSKGATVIYAGADDNASGTAGVLELARYYSVHRDPQNNYLIVLFTAEEKGLWGSEYFVRKMSPALKDSINFMLNFDMIGRLGCEGRQITAEAAGTSPYWKKLYREVKHPGFRLKKVSSSMPFSDQDAFYHQGIPVLYLTTGLHQVYHTPGDKPETINYTGMTGIIAYSEELVAKAGSGVKVPYRKVPEISLYLEMAGFIFGYIGEMLSF